MKKEQILKVYTDGAARGNPGPAASAFVLVLGEDIVRQEVEFIGNATNNTAEYKAIISALKTAEDSHSGKIQIFSDSKLAVNQITEKWKINYPHLVKLVKEIRQLMNNFQTVEIFHVNRSNAYIQICDRLCNERLDKAAK